MKKITIGLIIVAVMAILAFGLAYAASDSAVAHSQACNHASETGKAHASDNSVLNSCVPQTCPPNSVGIPPNCVCIFGTDPVTGTCLPPA